MKRIYTRLNYTEIYLYLFAVLRLPLTMNNKQAVGLEDEKLTDPHDLLSLLLNASSYICNIEVSNEADVILKDSLKSAFDTINKLLTDTVVEGVTINKARELHLSDSPVR